MNIQQFKSILEREESIFKEKGFKVFEKFNVISELEKYYSELESTCIYLEKLFRNDKETFEHSIQTLMLYVAYMPLMENAYDKRFSETFSEEQFIDCLKGVLLHDIGKSDKEIQFIKNLPSALTPVQKEVMQKHVDIGVNVYSRDFKSNESNIVKHHILYHHENTSASGYKQIKIKNPSIVLLNLCDMLSAISQTRSYSGQKDFSQTIEIMAKYNNVESYVIQFLTVA